MRKQMGEIGEVKEISIDLLKPYENNAKIHTKSQVKKIAASIEEFGFLNPVLIDRDYNIIAGHGRVEAMKILGETEVPCLFVEGLSEEQRRAYILADNKLTEMGEWDKELISTELLDLRTEGFDINLTGFNIDDIIITDEMGEAYTYEDFEEAVEESESRVHPGEIWKLGRHTLMCGDSTKEDNVQKLVGGGQR